MTSENRESQNTTSSAPAAPAGAEEMRSRKLRTGSNALASTALALGALVLVNVLAFRVVARIDLTENKVYTLTDASKRLAANLKDRLTVKAYISKDLPPQAAAVSRQLRDILEEYAAHSKGNMVWEAIDPAGDPKLESQARAAGINKASLQVIAKDKFEAKEVYLGVSFSYGGKSEKLPLVKNPDTLEYEISSLLKKLTVQKKKKIAFATGSGEPTFSSGLGHAKLGLEHFEVVTVNLKDGKPVPDDVDALIIIAGNNGYTPRAIYEIDQFLMRGKSVALLVDNVVIDPKTKLGRIAKHGLDKWLKHFGLELGKDLVLDLRNQRVQIQVQPGAMVVTNYPPFPIITKLERTDPMMRDLKGMVLPFVSSIDASEAKKNKDITVVELAKSSQRSWLQKGGEFFFVDPLRLPRPKDDTPKGPFTVAVSLRGKLKSYYAGKPVPSKDEKPGDEPKSATADAPLQSTPEDDKKGIEQSPASARLVVVGDGDFARDGYINNALNRTFFHNMVDWLAQDEDLISIRSKQVKERPLQVISPGTKAAVKYGNTFGVGLLCIAYGLFRWRARRRRARELKLADLA